MCFAGPPPAFVLLLNHVHADTFGACSFVPPAFLNDTSTPALWCRALQWFSAYILAPFTQISYNTAERTFVTPALLFYKKKQKTKNRHTYVSCTLCLENKDLLGLVSPICRHLWLTFFLSQLLSAASCFFNPSVVSLTHNMLSKCYCVPPFWLTLFKQMSISLCRLKGGSKMSPHSILVHFMQ